MKLFSAVGICYMKKWVHVLQFKQNNIASLIPPRPSPRGIVTWFDDGGCQRNDVEKLCSKNKGLFKFDWQYFSGVMLQLHFIETVQKAKERSNYNKPLSGSWKS